MINLSEAAARVKLDHAGLTMKISEESYSETVAGFGDLDRPGAGRPRTRERHGRRRHLTRPRAAQGARRPGPDTDDAQQALDEAKLEYGEQIERYDEKVPTGRAIGTDPAAGHSPASKHRGGRDHEQGPEADQDPQLHRQARRSR